MLELDRDRDRPDLRLQTREAAFVRDPASVTDEQSADHAVLLAEHRALEEEPSGQDEDYEEIEALLGKLEATMETLERRP